MFGLCRLIVDDIVDDDGDDDMEGEIEAVTSELAEVKDGDRSRSLEWLDLNVVLWSET